MFFFKKEKKKEKKCDKITMCCSENTNGSGKTRCGIVCGLAALVALTTALLGPAWLHTEEQLALPYLPRQFASAVTVHFKLGLFKVCPKIIKPTNATICKFFFLYFFLSSPLHIKIFHYKSFFFFL